MSVANRLSEAVMTPGKIGVKRFRRGKNSLTTTGERSRLASIETVAARGLLEGPDNPFRLVLPAYDGFTSDGSGGNQETFSLSHNVIESPSTTDVVVWAGGDRIGADSVDYGANTVDVTDPGSGNNIHVWYVTDAAAEMELVKRAPDGRSSSEQTLDNAALHHVHRQNQSDQPHYLSFPRDIDAWVPSDFALEIYINGTYQVALTDPDGDGAYAANALFQIPALKSSTEIEGLPRVVRDSMSR